MKPLPRPLSSVVGTPDVHASVARTWARIERTRASRSAVPRLALAGAAATLLIGLVWVLQPRPVEKVEVFAATPVPAPTPPPVEPVPAPAPGLESAMVQGRAKRTPRPVGEEPIEQPAEDVVAQVLASAVDAFVAGDAARAAALLSEAVEHHPDDPRTGEALVTLGWLQLEHLHQPADAARSLERALEHSLSQQMFDRAWPLLERARAER